jgi:hypothetical protein
LGGVIETKELRLASSQSFTLAFETELEPPSLGCIFDLEVSGSGCPYLPCFEECLK